VANHGADSATCGSATDPCRSLRRAIQNAAAGDRILVGPGRYGDLNRDGALDPAAGEEAGEDGTGCACLIKVDKRVAIESLAGAAATIVDAGGAAERIVRIQAGGVSFGKAAKGFTLTGGADFGVVIDAGATGVKVTGNLVTDTNLEAFSVAGSEHTLTRNVAHANGGEGFVVDGSAHVLTGNLAGGGGDNGFRLVFASRQVTLTGNVAAGNGRAGFRVTGADHTLTGNVASGNRAEGFRVFDTGHVLTGNTAAGNDASGVRLEPAASAAFTRGNLSGNDLVANCGLRNESGGAIDARNTFWGAATGPGADPADDVCNVGSTTTVAPFATKPIPLKGPALF
jgi:parallel beta-helix repeat protein